MIEMIFGFLHILLTLLGVWLILRLVYEPLIGILLLLVVSREQGFSHLRKQVSQLINSFFKKLFLSYAKTLCLLGEDFDDTHNTSEVPSEVEPSFIDDEDYNEWIEKRCEVLAVSPKEESLPPQIFPPTPRRGRVYLPPAGRGRGRGYAPPIPLPQHHPLNMNQNQGVGLGRALQIYPLP